LHELGGHDGFVKLDELRPTALVLLLPATNFLPFLVVLFFLELRQEKERLDFMDIKRLKLMDYGHKEDMISS
jgi:hypothetical protein